MILLLTERMEVRFLPRPPKNQALTGTSPSGFAELCRIAFGPRGDEKSDSRSLLEWSDVDSPLPEVLAYSDETGRADAEEMATTGVMSMPLVDRKTGRVCGQISAQGLLAGRRGAVERESERDSPFRID